MRMSDTKQKAIIHQLTAALGIDRDVYKEMLYTSYKVESSKDLNYRQATTFISLLKKKAVEAGVWECKKSFNKHKYSNLGNRDGFATPKQLRMIEVMWKEVSYQKTEQEKEEALNTFLLNHFGVSHLKWLEQDMVSKVVATLRAMKK